jgi:hypothetical protein
VDKWITPQGQLQTNELVDSTGERIMIDFYVLREVLKAHTDCPAVSCHEGPALLLAAAEDRDACFVRFVRPSASLVKRVNGSKVIWFPAPTAAARFAFAHRRLPTCHVDGRVRGPGMLQQLPWYSQTRHFFQRNCCRDGPYERKFFHSERAPYGANFKPVLSF